MPVKSENYCGEIIVTALMYRELVYGFNLSHKYLAKSIDKGKNQFADKSYKVPAERGEVRACVLQGPFKQTEGFFTLYRGGGQKMRQSAKI